MVDHPDRAQVLAQGEAPGAQQAFRIDQFKMSDAGMVVVAQLQARAVGPVAPGVVARRFRQQAAAGDHDQALPEM